MKNTTKRESGTPPRGPFARVAACVKSVLPPKAVSRWMSEQGKKGGAKSRRVLTSEQARAMVEAKRAKQFERFSVGICKSCHDVDGHSLVDGECWNCRQPRKVTIKLVGGSWMVLFVERAKFQRHSAGQFYAPDHSREFVEQWVKDNPRLELVNEA